MENLNKETYWSQFASDFEEKQAFVAGKEVISLTMKELSKEQNLGKVLELGCGTGAYTSYLHKAAHEICATDYSDEMIEVARQKRGQLNNVIFTKANAMDLQFENESFDTIFMANLIHIIDDPDQLLKESRRVLKNNGQIIITSFAIDQMSFINKLKLANRYLKTFGKPSKEASKVKTSKKAIEKLLVSNGFKIIHNKVIGNKEKAIYIKCSKVNG